MILAGCGDDSTEATSTDTVTLPASSAGKVYWLRDGKVWPVARELPATDTEAAAAAALLDGPSAEEESELDATTAIPADTGSRTSRSPTAWRSVTVSGDLSTEALAQIVYTLTQFPTVDSVEIDGKTYTRADFEDQTPAILVESPLPFDAVTSPIRATGTANTFEATFNYEVNDADRQGRRRELRHGDLGHRHARDVRVHDEGDFDDQQARRLRDLRRGRLAHPRGRDPADVAS